MGKDVLRWFLPMLVYSISKIFQTSVYEFFLLPVPIKAFNVDTITTQTDKKLRMKT